MYTYAIGIFMYKDAHHIHPRILYLMFLKNGEIHMHSTIDNLNTFTNQI